MSAKPALGFIGLGLMGSPMATRLLDAGHAVVVHNRTKAKADALAAKGAQWAASPAEVARRAEIVFTCILDTAGMERIVFGPGGVAEGAGPGKILVDFSTISAYGARAMADRLAKSGMRWIDAPVTGGPQGAAAGTLVAMAGGEAADIEAVRPHVAPMARRFEHLGPLGAGLFMKLCNQLVVGCTRVVLAEMVTLARKTGLDPASLPRVLEGGYADSTLLKLDIPRMVARDFAPRGQSKNVAKDLGLIREAAGAVGASLPVTALATELWRLHLAHGFGDKDSSSIIALFDETA